jgi:trk system potassium uptake protein TrkA
MMNIIVVGCGRVGTELAYRLFRSGHQVTVIDYMSTAFSNLPPDFRGRTIQGEALNQSVLHRAGIEKADGLALVTSSDTVNAVVAHAAKVMYGISNIVVRNYDPRWRSLYEHFGLQIVSSSSWGAQRIEELLFEPEGRAVHSTGNGEVEIYEVGIPASLHGHELGELIQDNPECLAVSLTRAGKATIPTEKTTIADGDLVLFSATHEGITALRQRVAQYEEKRQ